MLGNESVGTITLVTELQSLRGWSPTTVVTTKTVLETKKEVNY